MVIAICKYSDSDGARKITVVLQGTAPGPCTNAYGDENCASELSGDSVADACNDPFLSTQCARLCHPDPTCSLSPLSPLTTNPPVVSPGRNGEMLNFNVQL